MIMKNEVAVEDPLGVSEADIVYSGWDEKYIVRSGWTYAINRPCAWFAAFTGCQPLHNQVVIRVLRNADKLFPNSILFLPDSANDNKDHGAIGLVVAKGPGHRRKTTGGAWLEGYCELPVEVGDYVVFARASGEAHEFDGVSYLFTPIEHVWAVLEDYEAKTAPATEREFGLQSHIEKKWGRAGSDMPQVRGKHA